MNGFPHAKIGGGLRAFAITAFVVCLPRFDNNMNDAAHAIPARFGFFGVRLQIPPVMLPIQGQRFSVATQSLPFLRTWLKKLASFASILAMMASAAFAATVQIFDWQTSTEETRALELRAWLPSVSFVVLTKK